MDISAFRTGMGRLQALPPEEVAFAVQTAERLDDRDREDLYDRLVDMNSELSATASERQGVIGDMHLLAKSLDAAVQEFEDAFDQPALSSPQS
jgi:hypothetical protein